MKSILVFVFLFIFSSEVFSMGFGPKVCLASELTMTVFDNGEPVEGVRVIRSIKKSFGSRQTKTQEAITDIEGKIIMPAIYEHSFRKYLPTESLILQNVIIQTGTRELEGITLTKWNFEDGGELNNALSIKDNSVGLKPYAFTCDLIDLPQPRLLNKRGNGKFYGVCKHISE